MSLVPLSPDMLCLAYILSSSQLEQCGDYKAPWEVDLGGEGCAMKEMLPEQVSQPIDQSETPRTWLPAVPLCPGVIFISAQVLVMALRGEALTTGKGPVGHHCALCTAAGVAESAGLLTQQGYSSAESNQQCSCWIRGSVCSLGFIPMTPLLYWLDEK